MRPEIGNERYPNRVLKSAINITPNRNEELKLKNDLEQQLLLLEQLRMALGDLESSALSWNETSGEAKSRYRSWKRDVANVLLVKELVQHCLHPFAWICCKREWKLQDIESELVATWSLGCFLRYSGSGPSGKA